MPRIKEMDVYFVGDNHIPCLRCGYCCGHRRKNFFGGTFYRPHETIPDGVEVIYDGEEHVFKLPVNEDDVCIYLNVENDITTCTIHDIKPEACREWYCPDVRKQSILKSRE